MLIHSKGKALSLSSWRGRSSYYFTKYECGGVGGRSSQSTRREDRGRINSSESISVHGRGSGRVVRGPIPGQDSTRAAPSPCVVPAIRGEGAEEGCCSVRLINAISVRGILFLSLTMLYISPEAEIMYCWLGGFV